MNLTCLAHSNLVYYNLPWSLDETHLHMKTEAQFVYYSLLEKEYDFADNNELNFLETMNLI